MPTRAHPGILLCVRARIFACQCETLREIEKKEMLRKKKNPKTMNALNSARISPEQHYHTAPLPGVAFINP